MATNLAIINQTNTKLIIYLLRKEKKMRRSDIYKKVIQLRRKRDNKSISYQVVSRDVQRLLDAKLIKIIGGGKRSQIISIN